MGDVLNGWVTTFRLSQNLTSLQCLCIYTWCFTTNHGFPEKQPRSRPEFTPRARGCAAAVLRSWPGNWAGSASNPEITARWSFLVGKHSWSSGDVQYPSISRILGKHITGKFLKLGLFLILWAMLTSISWHWDHLDQLWQGIDRLGGTWFPQRAEKYGHFDAMENDHRN